MQRERERETDYLLLRQTILFFFANSKPAWCLEHKSVYQECTKSITYKNEWFILLIGTKINVFCCFYLFFLGFIQWICITFVLKESRSHRESCLLAIIWTNISAYSPALGGGAGEWGGEGCLPFPNPPHFRSKTVASESHHLTWEAGTGNWAEEPWGNEDKILVL